MVPAAAGPALTTAPAEIAQPAESVAAQSPVAPEPSAAPPDPDPVVPAPAAPPVVPLAGVPTAIRLSDSAEAIPVVPIGVEADGVLDPPEDIATAGWWVAGPRPGGPGRTVITGHVDSRAAGLGAFAALDELQPGDRVTVTTVDSRRLIYVVTQRDEIRKTQLDPAFLRGSDNSDLLLVTCIGEFDRAARSYESNLLITAVPVSD